MFESIQTFVVGTIAIVLTFGLAVFVHEFGHMFFALIRGVGVESFAIGMGPKICDWQWRGIDFSLRWFPVGGFVKLKGMIAEENQAATESTAPTNEGEQPAQLSDEELENKKTVSESSYDDLLALSNKGLLTKLMVFGGGVFMNYVTAILAMVFFLMLPKDHPDMPFEVYGIDKNALGLENLFQRNDRVIALNGEPLTQYGQFIDRAGQALEAAADAQNIPLEEARAEFKLTVDRAGQNVEVPLGSLDMAGLKDFIAAIEIVLPPVVDIVIPTKPADKAGIKTGDRLLSVDGKPVSTFNDMADIINHSMGREIVIAYERDGKVSEVKLTPEESLENPQSGMIGITAGSHKTYRDPGVGIGEALVRAPGETWLTLKRLVEIQVDFFKRATFKQIKDNLGGPIMIAGMTQRAAERGLADSVQWFITLNLLLLVFNLLPLPVLDGGFILISIIEAVIRRPIPPRVIAPIYTAFVFLFIGLMVVISLLDVQRWFF